MKKADDGNAFSEAKHKHAGSVATLDYVHVHRSIIYVTAWLAKHTH